MKKFTLNRYSNEAIFMSTHFYNMLSCLRTYVSALRERGGVPGKPCNFTSIWKSPLQDYLRRRFATTGVEHPNIQPNEDLDELASRMSEDLGLVEPRAPSQEPEELGTGTTEPPPVSEPEQGTHPLVPCTSSESTAVAVQRPEPTSSTPGTKTCSGEHHVQPTKVYPRRDRRAPQYYGT